MPIRGTTRLLGILGTPLSHSYSPAMHNGGIEALGLDLVYLPLPVETANLSTVIHALKAVHFLGLNVTIPHKQAVLPLLDELSDISQKMGVVNTIVNRNGKLFGTTTDPEGFLRGFTDAGHSFEGKSVVILGNGGSARTIAFALSLMAGPKRVALAARDLLKSGSLALEIAAKTGRELELLTLEDYPASAAGFDIVVNTTPLGMSPDIASSPLSAAALHPGQVVYDILYNPEETTLMRLARERGCAVVGGLGMLVHQGLASFKLWTGLEPDPETFYAGIRAQQAAAASPVSPRAPGSPA
jgi:shikimate dehydrogenase